MKPHKSLACLLFFSVLAVGQSHPQTDPAPTIHQSALIIDTHADTPQRFLDENFDLGQNTPVAEGHIDLGKIKQGNLGAEFFSIWVEPEFKGHYSRRAMDLIDSVYQQATRHPDKIAMAFSVDDIEIGRASCRERV